MKLCPNIYFRCCGYFHGPWVSFVMTDEFSVRVTKITSRIGVLWTHRVSFFFWPILTQWILVILSKGCEPDSFESHNSLKHSFVNVWGLCSNFFEKESLLESNSSDILVLCETDLDESIDSGNFSVMGYLHVIWKDSITHIHGLAVYVKKGQMTYLSKTRILNYVFNWLSSLSVLLLFPLSIIFFVFMHSFFILFHLIKMMFSWATHLLMCLSP